MDFLYKNALKHVLETGVEQFNERTKTKILACHGYSFRWNAANHPVLYGRKSFPKTAAAELAWFLSGETSVAWINKHTSIWRAFANAYGEIPTAYGHRWRRAFGIDQIKNIICKLNEDPTSRQQVLMSWDPRVDNVVPASNIPCPYTYVFNIIDNKLNAHMTVRSNDIWLGLPYDLYTAVLLVNALANSLGVEAGEIFYSIAHMHLYENQFEVAKEFCYNRELIPLEIRVRSKMTVEEILADKDAYVEDIIYDTQHYHSSNWNPKVQIVV